MRLSQLREDDAKEAANKGYSLWKNIENSKLPPLPILEVLLKLESELHLTDSPLYPPPAARLSCAKLFLELSQHVPALEILQTLEGEDDEDSETWYLSGWAWWLLGESRGDKASNENEESKEECWSEAKLCLENYLKVRRKFFLSFTVPMILMEMCIAVQIEEREPESTDPEQMAHVQEVLSKLNEAGIEASQGAAGEGYKVGNGGEEWEDASDEEMEE